MIATKAKTSITLYDYQEKMVNDIENAFLKCNSIIGVLPTGGGKTIISSSLIQKWTNKGCRVLYLAHKEELIFQPWRTLYKQFGILPSIIKSKLNADYSLNVQIASIPSLKNRPFPYGIDYIIIDEGHHTPAQTYIDEMNRAKEQNPNVKILGLSATPRRTDGVGLGTVFEEMILGPTTIELEERGFLCPPKVISVPINPKLFDGLRLNKKGEYSTKITSRIMNDSAITEYAITTWERHAKGLPTLVYCNSVEHSKAVAAAFRKRGYNFIHLDGSKKKVDNTNELRQHAKSRLTSGQWNGISNCMLFIEGVDVPAVRCIMDLQITASIITHRQKGGRGSRLFTDENGNKKTHYVYLDFVNACLEHGEPNCNVLWSLAGHEPTKDKRGEMNLDGVILKVIDAKGKVKAITSNSLRALMSEEQKFLSDDFTIVEMHADEKGRLELFDRFLRRIVKDGENRRKAFFAFKKHCIDNLEKPTIFELQYVQYRTGMKNRFAKPWAVYQQERIIKEINTKMKQTGTFTYQVCIHGNKGKYQLTTRESEFQRNAETCIIYQIPKNQIGLTTKKWLFKYKEQVNEISKTSTKRAEMNIQYLLMSIPKAKLIFAKTDYEKEIVKKMNEKNEKS